MASPFPSTPPPPEFDTPSPPLRRSSSRGTPVTPKLDTHVGQKELRRLLRVADQTVCLEVAWKNDVVTLHHAEAFDPFALFGISAHHPLTDSDIRVAFKRLAWRVAPDYHAVCQEDCRLLSQRLWPVVLYARRLLLDGVVRNAFAACLCDIETPPGGSRRRGKKQSENAPRRPEERLGELYVALHRKHNKLIYYLPERGGTAVQPEDPRVVAKKERRKKVQCDRMQSKQNMVQDAVWSDEATSCSRQKRRLSRAKEEEEEEGAALLHPQKEKVKWVKADIRRHLRHYSTSEGSSAGSGSDSPDGSVGVGGTLPLRCATVLSIASSIPASVTNPLHRRGGRQHALSLADQAGLTALQGTFGLGYAKLTEDEYTFTPGDAGVHEALAAAAKEGVAGRCAKRVVDTKSELIGQAALWLLPTLLLGTRRSHTVELTGATDGGSSSTFDMLAEVHLPVLGLFGGHASVELKRRGVRGGGHAILRTSPAAALLPVQLTEQGPVTEIHIRVWVSSGLAIDNGKRAIHAALGVLEKHFPDVHSVLNMELLKDNSVGCDTLSVFVRASTDRGCMWCGHSIGGRGTKAEHSGIRAAQQLVSEHEKGCCLPTQLQEQTALLMALAPGTSRVRFGLPLTPECQTVIYAAERLIPSVKYTFVSPPINASKNVILECARQ